MNGKSLTRLGAAMLLALSLLGGERAPAAEPKEVAAGVELDVLPYATGGYYGSAWVGRGRFRVRPVVASATVPSFLVEEGFEDREIDARALLVDYFFRDGFRGPWVGAGLERWESRVTREADGTGAEWSNTVATVGGGWVWRIGGHFTVNPWVAGHLVVGGPTSVAVGDATYDAKRFTPEASVKLGWTF